MDIYGDLFIEGWFRYVWFLAIFNRIEKLFFQWCLCVCSV